MMMKKTIVAVLLLQLSTWGLADEMYLSNDAPSASAVQANAGDTSYRIPFPEGSSHLGPTGKNTVSEIIPRLRRAQKIVVQGRPDSPGDAATSSKATEKTLSIPQKRAQVLKQLLINYGIAESKILIEQLGEPSYSDTPKVYNATIKVYDYAQSDEQFRSDPTAVVSLSSASKLNGIGRQPGIPVSSIRKVLKTAVDNNLSAMDTGRLFESWIVVESPMLASKKPMNPNEALIPVATVRRVLKVAIESNLSAIDASRMFESWMAVEYATPTAAQSSSSILTSTARQGTHAGQYMMAEPSIPTVSATPYQAWHLEPSKTLRDNIGDWARQAGWNPPQWQATNNYQVTSAMDFNGNLPDALRQISDQAKLNICITHAQKTIKVTDSNVSCKD